LSDQRFASTRGKCDSRVADCSHGEKSIAGERLAELDDIIRQPLRLKIVAALGALPVVSGLESPA
jgi:hypothetical protein